MAILRDLKIKLEERFHDKWTSLSVQHHFKLMASHLMNLSFSEVNIHLETVVSENQITQFDAWLKQLEEDQPIQYILGETEFRNVRIFCSPAALIPRPETEEMVECIVNQFADFPAPKVLDLCTGTGCIAISIQNELPESQVEGIDNFDDVIELAKKNSRTNMTSVAFTRVDVLSADEMSLFSDESYDVWVSNPPYIPEKDKAEMSDNVLKYEPSAALFVEDQDPLLFYRHIAHDAMKGLKDGGKLFFEIHENYGEEIIVLLKGLGFTQIEIHPDLQGKERMISAQKR